MKQTIKAQLRRLGITTLLVGGLALPVLAQEEPEFFTLNQPQLEQIVENDPDVFRFFKEHPETRNVKAGYAPGCNTLYLTQGDADAADKDIIEKFKLDSVYAEFFENKLRKKTSDPIVTGDGRSCRLILTSNPCNGTVNIEEVQNMINIYGGIVHLTINFSQNQAESIQSAGGNSRDQEKYQPPIPQVHLSADASLGMWSIPASAAENEAIRKTMTDLERAIGASAEKKDINFPKSSGQSPIVHVGVDILLHHSADYAGRAHIGGIPTPFKQNARLRFDIPTASSPLFSWEYAYTGKTWIVQAGYAGTQKLGNDVFGNFSAGGILGISKYTFDITKIQGSLPPDSGTEFQDFHTDRTVLEPGYYISLGIVPRIKGQFYLGIGGEYIWIKSNDNVTDSRTFTRLYLRLQKGV